MRPLSFEKNFGEQVRGRGGKSLQGRTGGKGRWITWVILNRPEKRNAMKPQMDYDMLDCFR